MTPLTQLAGKCIVITGARGYIGGALVRRLAQPPCTLRLVSRSSVPASVDTAGQAKLEHVAADLSNERSWSELLADADAVIHLSSRPDLRAAEADPSGDESINVEPVKTLVRAAKLKPAQTRIVFASAVTIVGDRHANPVDEATPDNPRSVYDRHKLACERLLRDATKQGLLRACSLRLSNVYGYGGVSINSNRGILNAMMERAARGEPLTLYGDGSYIRDFVHLDDVVEAFCLAAASDRVCDGSAYVVTSGRGHSLAEAFNVVANEAQHVLDRPTEIQYVREPGDLHPIDRRNFIGNPSLFGSRTGWRAKIDLESGIHDYFVRFAAQPALAG